MKVSNWTRNYDENEAASATFLREQSRLHYIKSSFKLQEADFQHNFFRLMLLSGYFLLTRSTYMSFK